MHAISDKINLLSLLNHKDGQRPPEGLDWNAVFDIAEHSRVTALLFDQIKGKLSELSVPDDVYGKLKTAYQLNAIRNALVLEEFDRLRERLERANISCILLKGICLTNTIFRERVGTRVMGDVDILVREPDAEKADPVFKDLGYHLPPSDVSYLDDMKRRRKAAMYLKFDDNGHMLAPVHLHWHIINVSRPFLESHWSSICMDDIWKEAFRLKPEDNTLLVMSPEHMVVSLAAHSFNHGFSRIDLAYDLHSYTAAYRKVIDWKKITELAHVWHVEMPLRMGLALSKKMFDTPVPGSTLDDLYRTGRSIIESWYERYAYARAKPSEDISPLLYYASSKGIAGKLDFLRSAFALRLLPAEN